MANSENREFFEIIKTLAKEIRCCSQEEALYEGITFQQFVILDAVAKEKEILLADLHGILYVEKSTTTRLVDPLVAKGFLKRTPALHDSRAIKLVITAEGLEISKKVWAHLGAFFRQVLAKIPSSDRKNMFASMKALTEALRGVLEETRCC